MYVRYTVCLSYWSIHKGWYSFWPFGRKIGKICFIRYQGKILFEYGFKFSKFKLTYTQPNLMPLLNTIQWQWKSHKKNWLTGEIHSPFTAGLLCESCKHASTATHVWVHQPSQHVHTINVHSHCHYLGWPWIWNTIVSIARSVFSSATARAPFKSAHAHDRFNYRMRCGVALFFLACSIVGERERSPFETHPRPWTTSWWQREGNKYPRRNITI